MEPPRPILDQVEKVVEVCNIKPKVRRKVGRANDLPYHKALKCRGRTLLKTKKGGDADAR